MLHASFVCQEHQESGSNGWVLKTKPFFDPAAGMQLAHDVLEEFPNGKDQPHDELMALGASIYTRGEGGYFRDSWHEAVASDFPEIFRHLEEGGYFLKLAPKQKRCEDWVESQFLVPLELEVRKQAANAEDDYDWGHVKANLDYIPHAINWMRLGFKKAKRRFNKVDSCTLSYMFRDLEKKADEILKYAEIGDELRVNVNIRRAWVEVKHINYYETEEGRMYA